MARLLLGVTGSVASVKIDELVCELVGRCHEVRIVMTQAADFFVPHWVRCDPHGPFPVFRDRDEWPEQGWERGDPVLHIELGRWADAMVIAPLDAHTLAKWAQGQADNLLTSVLRAWDYSKPLIVAPAMNTRMWENPVTRRHFAQILSDRNEKWPDNSARLPGIDALIAAYDQFREPLRIVSPTSKVLACGDYGIGAMAEIRQIADRLDQEIAHP